MNAPPTIRTPNPRLGRIAGAPPTFFVPALEKPQLLAAWPGNRIFEDFSVRTYVTADGARAIRVAVEGYGHVWNRTADGVVPNEDEAFADIWNRLIPCGDGLLQFQGMFGEGNWFLLKDGAATPLDWPGPITPVASPDGSHVLHYEWSPIFRTAHPGHDLWLGTLAERRHIALDGPIMGGCFSPDNAYAYVLVRQPDGASTLVRIGMADYVVVPLAHDLDSPPYPPGSVSVAATADSVYLPMIGVRAPDEAGRHRPTAPRFVNIFRYDLATGGFERMVTSAADLHDVAIGGGALHWIRSVCQRSAVTFPIGGGDLVQVAEAGYLPEWAPEGDRISYTIGQFRIADWATPLDCHVVSVDEHARPASEPSVFVDGNHEDFTALWSPCGRWVAYHTHRCPEQANVPFYDAIGARDAIFVRAAEDTQAPETEISENGWEIYKPVWSPEGRTIVYFSWDRNGIPGIGQLFAIDFDTETGRKLGHRSIPHAEGINSVGAVDWMPDGKHLIIENDYEPGRRALWIMTLDGSSARKLHDYRAHTYGGVSRTPDGRTIIFSGLDDNDRMVIYSIPAEGGEVSLVQSDAQNLMHPVVSPDGRFIACTRHMTTQQWWSAGLAA